MRQLVWEVVQVFALWYLAKLTQLWVVQVAQSKVAKWCWILWWARKLTKCLNHSKVAQVNSLETINRIASYHLPMPHNLSNRLISSLIKLNNCNSNNILQMNWYSSSNNFNNNSNNNSNSQVTNIESQLQPVQWSAEVQLVSAGVQAVDNITTSKWWWLVAQVLNNNNNSSN